MRKLGLYILMPVLLVSCSRMGPGLTVDQVPQTHYCESGYKGLRVTSTELSEILEAFSKWRLSGHSIADAGWANLCESNLAGINLPNADLSELNLWHAHLEDSHLEGAKLRSANLEGAHLWKAHLEGADLEGAHLRQADLSEADLKGVSLRDADLWEADLSEVNLQEAIMIKANLKGAIFEIIPGALPSVNSIARVRGLEEITFILPYSAVELREAFKKAGLRDQERAVTYAINYTRTRQAWGINQAYRQIREQDWGLKRELAQEKNFGPTAKIETVFNYLMFEATCLYGMSPGRPLWILVVSLLLFAIPYWFALKSQGSAGIWVVWSPDRVHKREGQEEPVRVTDEFFFSNMVDTKWQWLSYKLRLIRVALYFSLLSAFQIGWRELNVGNWISRVQSREYALRATGWVRTISGIQSIVSVYLLALWVLSYFGRPFD